MPVHLNHTIVAARCIPATTADSRRRSRPATRHHLGLQMVFARNDVSLDVVATPAPRAPPATRLSWRTSIRRDRGASRLSLRCSAARPPAGRQINTNDGGRGLYWLDPNGHNLEIITVPYGG